MHACEAVMLLQSGGSCQHADWKSVRLNVEQVFEISIISAIIVV